MPNSKPKSEKVPGSKEPVAKTEPNARWWVKLLLFLHVLAITSWALPRTGQGVLNGKVSPVGTEWLLYFNDKYVKTSPIQLYVLSTGSWQSWDMFSPNPANTDIYPDAEVHYQNGTVKTYRYPRMYSLPLVEKYIKERYRKFFEHANSDEYLWPYFAQRVILMHSDDPNNPVVKVVLHRHWVTVPRIPPFSTYCSNVWDAVKNGKLNADVLFPPTPPLDKQYGDFVFYQYPPAPSKGPS